MVKKKTGGWSGKVKGTEKFSCELRNGSDGRKDGTGGMRAG